MIARDVILSDWAVGKKGQPYAKRVELASRFRGAGRGKKDYAATSGHNPTRLANGGRI